MHGPMNVKRFCHHCCCILHYLWSMYLKGVWTNVDECRGLYYFTWCVHHHYTTWLLRYCLLLLSFLYCTTLNLMQNTEFDNICHKCSSPIAISKATAMKMNHLKFSTSQTRSDICVHLAAWTSEVIGCRSCKAM